MDLKFSKKVKEETCGSQIVPTGTHNPASQLSSFNFLSAKLDFDLQVDAVGHFFARFSFEVLVIRPH